MVCISFTKKLNPKVVDTQGEGGRSSPVTPKTWCERHWVVTERSKVRNKVFESKKTRFFQPINTFPRLDVNETIGLDDESRIFGEDFLRDE